MYQFHFNTHNNTTPEQNIWNIMHPDTVRVGPGGEIENAVVAVAGPQPLAEGDELHHSRGHLLGHLQHSKVPRDRDRF